MDKTFIEANKDQYFKGNLILEEAYASLITLNREEALAAARKLYIKEYQTRKEIKDLENKLATAQQSLEKTEAKIAKVASGDLSALFEGGSDKPSEKKEEAN